EKLLQVQDDVAQQIIKGLEVNLSPSEAARMKPETPVNPVAYEYYLRGVDLYSRGEFAMAIKMLEASNQMDSHYALNWAQLGRAYTASASFQFGGQDQYRKAQAAFEKALALRPEQIDTRVYMANLLTDTGEVEKAVPLLQAQVGEALAHGIRFQEPKGIDLLRQTERKVEEQEVGDPEASYKIAQAYAVLGDKASALRILQRSVEGGFFPYTY